MLFTGCVARCWVDQFQGICGMWQANWYREAVLRPPSVTYSPSFSTRCPTARVLSVTQHLSSLRLRKVRFQSDNYYNVDLFCYVHSLTCGSPCCNCIRPCHSLQFVPYIVKRQPMVTTEPNHRFSQLYLFYNSRMVQVAEEHLAYDWSLFLSDLGGSLGFLLGLSVLGIIGIVERLIDLLYGSLQLPAQVKTSGGRQLGLNSNKDSDEHMDCICCRAEEKSLSLHNMETMKCKSKLSPQPHDTKY